MRNLDTSTAYMPAARTRQVTGMGDVFRAEPEPARGEWVKTSVNLRPDMRIRLKRYAAEHDMKIQEVIDSALETYLR